MLLHMCRPCIYTNIPPLDMAKLSMFSVMGLLLLQWLFFLSLKCPKKGHCAYGNIALKSGGGFQAAKVRFRPTLSGMCWAFNPPPPAAGKSELFLQGVFNIKNSFDFLLYCKSHQKVCLSKLSKCSQGQGDVLKVALFFFCKQGFLGLIQRIHSVCLGGVLLFDSRLSSIRPVRQLTINDQMLCKSVLLGKPDIDI